MSAAVAIVTARGPTVDLCGSRVGPVSYGGHEGEGVSRCGNRSRDALRVIGVDRSGNDAGVETMQRPGAFFGGGPD